MRTNERNEAGRGRERERAHTQDGDCRVSQVTGCCKVCGVEHGDPCGFCRGRGFHADDCRALMHPTFDTYTLDAFNEALRAFRDTHADAERVTPMKFALETFVADCRKSLEKHGADTFYRDDLRGELVVHAALCIRLEHVKFNKYARADA